MPIMGWMILVAVFVAGAWLCTGAMSSRPAGGTGPNQTGVTAVRSRDLKTLNRQQIQKMLQRIATTKPPAPKMGAMCYEMVAPPSRAEYVCPTCGEKTLYTQQQAYRVNGELQDCRRIMKEMANSAVTLDESAWCRKCQPDVKEPALVLRLRYDDGTTRTVEKVKSDQLRLLRDFFAGQLLVKGVQDRETPLKEKLGELETLLGEKPPQTKE